MDPVAVHTVLRVGSDAPLVVDTRRLQLVERIDQPFEATVEWVTADLDLDVRTLLGTRAQLEIERPQVCTRVLHGVVTEAEYRTTRNQQLTARVQVEPSLALLRYGMRRRIFADQTLQEVLTAVTDPVFTAHGGRWDFGRLTVPVPARDYRVQYDETDLAFVLRLLAEHGLCLLHGEGEGETVYVVTDRNAALPGIGLDPAIPTESTPWAIPFDPEGEEEASEPSVQYLAREDGLVPAGVRVRARDWKAPGWFETRIDAAAPGRVGERHVHHPGRLDEGPASDARHHDDTDTWATRTFEALRAEGVRVSGASNFSDLGSGATFELQGHPQADLDQRYAVLSVVHQADLPEVDVQADPDARPSYTNRFVAQPLQTGAVRPPLGPRPRVCGIEAATVVGPEGEEIHTDALGRVRVRFHWDDAPGQTCWLRVLSPWAGPGYGACFVPRVGMEVVVGFLGGDPDRPVVTGCLYTGGNQPPGALPDTKTQTTLRSRSSPGGEGFNALRFEDAAGREEVFVHAQRNLRTVVRAAQSTRVGASRSLSVGTDSTRTIAGNETVQIGGDDPDTGNLEVRVTGGESRTVHEGHELTAERARWRVATTLHADATDEMRLSCAETGTVLTLAPTTVTLDAPQSIDLRVGASRLQLTPRGVFIDGPVFMARATEYAETAAPGGRVVFSQDDAVMVGPPPETSRVRLVDAGAHIETPGALTVSGDTVTVVADSQALMRSPNTHVVGSKKALLEGNAVAVQGDLVGVAAKGLVDVKGKPIHLNC